MKVRLLAYLKELGPYCFRQNSKLWDVAIDISSLKELADKLEKGFDTPKDLCGNRLLSCDPIQKGQIEKLGIVAHGDQAGRVHVAGKKRSPMTINNLSQYRKSWDRIKPFLQSNGYVVFLSCLTAWGDAGTRLLKALSKLLPDQTIVGFNTIGYQHPGDSKRRGKACMDFKIKSTDTKLVRSHGYYVKKYNKFLLQNINCKEAKWVRNGIVRRWPMDEWTFQRNLTDKFGRPKDMLKHKDTLNLRSRQLKKRALHQ